MILILDRLDVDGNIRPATHKLCQRLRAGHDSFAMRFELLEKIAGARQQLLKPSEHISP